MKQSWWLNKLIAVYLCSLPFVTIAGCTEDLPIPADKKLTLDDVSPTSLDPKVQLQRMAQEAINNSSRLDAVKSLAEAASFDMDEARGTSMPQVSINASLGPAATKFKYAADSKGFQSTAGVNVTGLLYDGGRLSSLIRWREELAKSALSGARSAREQVIYEAISIGLERNRYKVQAQIFHQQARKMSCLVELLSEIVSQDKGRTSELLQARKTQAQAEVSRDNALALGRQMELRLRKIIGDQATVGEGIAVPLSISLERSEVIRQIAFHPDILQLRSQVYAAEQLALSVDAKKKPQLNWTASSVSYSREENKSVSLQAGVTMSYNIFNWGADRAASMAAHKRTDASRQQLEEFIKTLNNKVTEVFDVANSAQERAKKYESVLKDSDRLRMSTFQQWSQLGRRSLFDVMSAESDYFNLRIAYVNVLHDGYQANAQLRALGGELSNWLELPY